MRRWVLAISAIVLISSNAHADSPGEEGVTLEKKGDYDAALVKFRESAAIKRTLGNRFHLAFCLEMTGKLSAALNEYEVVDKTAREQKKAEIIEATRLRLEPLRPRVPQLALRVTPRLPPNAEVLLDGNLVAPGLLDGKAFRVDPGSHVVTAHAPEHENVTRTVPLSEGANVSVEVPFEAVTVAPAHVVTEPPPEPPPKRDVTLPILTTAGAVLLAGGGVFAFFVASGAGSDAEKECPQKRACDSEQTKVRTFDTLALSGFIGGAALGVLSVVLWTSSPSPRRAALITRPSWIGLEGRF